MPVANCIVSPDCVPGTADLAELWAEESGCSAEHMTINIITGNQQFGRQYSVMANLYLPSLWSSEAMSALQTGLAGALSVYFTLSAEEILVITQIIDSGNVVENTKEVDWKN